MKYLKRFNEELSSNTYMSAARKLKKIGNKSSLDRAETLKSWAGETKKKEEHSDWLKGVEEYSKFGTPVKAKLESGKNLGFYIDVSFDPMSFADTLECELDNNPDNVSGSIPFYVRLVPATQKDFDESTNELGFDYFGTGFQAYYINVDYTIINDVVTLTNFELYQEEEVMITLSPIGASRLKDLLIKILSDRTLNYPSSDTRYENEYETLNATIIMEAGFSSTYGFELQDIADYIATIPKQKFIN